MFSRSSRVLPQISGLLTRQSGPVTTRRYLPYCAVSASTPDSKLPQDLAKGLSKVLADTLNKPEQVSSYQLVSNW